MDGFSIDIITSILSKLPAKWVLSCRSVCKTWCSIIDNPHFLNTHWYTSTAQIETNDPSSFILIPSDYKGHYKGYLFIVEDASSSASSSSSSTQQDRIVKSSEIFLSCSDDDSLPLSLLGFSHGLICFSFCQVGVSENILYTFYVCNPATQEYDTLPQAILPKLGSKFIHVALGFGFSDSTNQFKVVIIFHWKKDNGERDSEVRMYTIGSNSWRSVIADYPDEDVSPISGNSLASVSGSLHWLTHFSGENFKYHFRIISFDLGLENFGVVPNPHYIHIPNPTWAQYDGSVHPERIQIGVLGGCLCLTDCGYQGYEYDIWVMKQYNVSESWTRQYVISQEFMDEIYVLVIHPVIVRMNGDLVLVCDTRYSQFLVSYNPQKGTAIPIEDDQLPKCEDEYVYYDYGITTYVAFPYVASLISPKSICRSDSNFQEDNA